jgi:pyroglutamyl-peptidase
VSELKVLIGGFGRFPGAPFNPSASVARALARRRRPALADARRVAHVFAVRYADVDRELPALIARERPDVVLLFGLAGRARHLRIELVARNRMSVLFPDAGGYRPAHPAIAPGRPALRNPRPLARLVEAAREAGVLAAPSRNAGSYLCNYIYWRALEAARTPGGPRLVAFVHVPPVKRKARPSSPSPSSGRAGVGPSAPARSKLQTPPYPPRKRGGKGPSRLCKQRRHVHRLNDLVRASEAILVAMVALARMQRPVTLAPTKLP